MSEQQHQATPVEPTEGQQVSSLNASEPSGSTEQHPWSAPSRDSQHEQHQYEMDRQGEERLEQHRPMVPALPRTGDQQVDDALASLLAVQDLEPSDQVEAYVGAHRALKDRLADLEG